MLQNIVYVNTIRKMLIEINLTQLQGKQNIKSGCDEYYLHIQLSLSLITTHNDINWYHDMYSWHQITMKIMPGPLTWLVHKTIKIENNEKRKTCGSRILLVWLFQQLLNCCYRAAVINSPASHQWMLRSINRTHQWPLLLTWFNFNLSVDK